MQHFTSSAPTITGKTVEQQWLTDFRQSTVPDTITVTVCADAMHEHGLRNCGIWFTTPVLVQYRHTESAAQVESNKEWKGKSNRNNQLLIVLVQYNIYGYLLVITLDWP
jgi:hypothetical protein